MSDKRILFASVFGPYGIKNKYAEGLGMQMDMLNNQITRQQGVHSLRQFFYSYNLYLMAENISIPSTVLDFPSWREFKREIGKGYSHIAITFIVPNILKVKRMTEYIREKYPSIKILLGGYGTIIPDLDKFVSYDAVCQGEGVEWLRNYFGDSIGEPLRHPVLKDYSEQRIYGYKYTPKTAIILGGIGCKNGCDFCITSYKFNRKYEPFLKTGKEMFAACEKAEKELDAKFFGIIDENFLNFRDRAKEFLAQMERHGKVYLFQISSSCNNITDLGVDFLVRLGIQYVMIGVESQTAHYEKLKGVNFHNLIADLQSHGISVIATVMLFQEHHDRKNLEKDIDWAISLKSDFVQFLNFTPYPGTSLYERLKKEGRLIDLPYRYMHGLNALAFVHPYFNNPKDHRDILKLAFKKKYLVDGPSVMNVINTNLKGFINNRKEFEERQGQGYSWDPETCRYEKNTGSSSDDYMIKRIGMMRKMAILYRPILLCCYVFAPNKNSRSTAKQIIRLYKEVFGKQSIKEVFKSYVLVVYAFVELIKTFLSQAFGRETVIRQPKCARRNYPSKLL